MNEHLVRAATLLPWWINLILAEISFVALHLMGCFYAQFIVPALFIGASMLATAENEKRRQEEMRQARAKQADDNMLVTKVILKDLMKGGYREIEQKTGMRREEPERPDLSKYMIIELIAVTSIGSSMIMIDEIGKESKKGNKQADPPAQKTVEYIPPRPVIQPKPAPVVQKPQIQKKIEKDYSQYEYQIDLTRKSLEKNEKITNYKVFFKNGNSTNCKHILHLYQNFICLDENKRKKEEFPEYYVNDMDRESTIPGGHKVTVLRPEDFY